MIDIRRSLDRGHAEHGWLESYHTFSFADYSDPRAPHNMGFRALRVINEDRVQPAQGFGTHSHRDMEIISYVLEGGLEHADSMGNGSVIRAGEVQRMSAGSGVTHSEYNASRDALVHFLQIWILPARRGIEPSYEQKSFSEEARRGRLRLVASGDAREGSVKIHQDVDLYTALLQPRQSTELGIARGRHAWVQVARGDVELNGTPLGEGDGAALIDEPCVLLTARDASEILVFDLA
ncbi:MAG: pirin family protein [Myxococcales bacterium]|nr:MAG: pirin family protein [Myxococcales bacterium]